MKAMSRIVGRVSKKALRTKQIYAKAKLIHPIVYSFARRHSNNLAYGNGGWLPSSPVITHEYQRQKVKRGSELNEAESDYLKKLINLLDNDPLVNKLATQMIKEAKGFEYPFGGPPINNLDDLKHGLIGVDDEPFPPFLSVDNIIGVPVAALLSNLDGTPSGQTLFRYNEWNNALMDFVKGWGDKLFQQSSFPQDGAWLSLAAQAKWNKGANGPDNSIWEFPEKCCPFWKSWNDFFSRDVKRECRPVAEPENHNIITSCNDGQYFRYRTGIKYRDTVWNNQSSVQIPDVQNVYKIWIKNMPYSLVDIFGGEDDDFAKQMAKEFQGGQIFQSFLNPFNYHGFWSPVAGKVIYSGVIPGLLFSKCVAPDISTTGSLPYLLNVNSRGIFVIDTSGYANIGLVCCVPIGMADVSSINWQEKFSPENVAANQPTIEKGEKFGNFYFGGSSSFAIIFQSGANITWKPANGVPYLKDASMTQINPTKQSTILEVGQQIGVIHPQ